jgi:uncharacterized repeat protein (TIGR03803 family)
MQSKQQFCNLISRIISRVATVALAIAIVFALTVVMTQSAPAQTFTVLHTFRGGGDGASPMAGLTMDQAGNFYGTATAGGGSGAGTVFRLSKKGSSWILNTLYSFAKGNDGASPRGGVIFGPNGNLYGTTMYGGGDGCSGSGCGIVFQLKQYPTACKTALCGWQETVLHRFTGNPDGAWPASVDLIFDQAGNLYGTTQSGGTSDEGTVFQLAPSGLGWTENVLYSFFGGGDGQWPSASLIFDNAGNLYSTTFGGGAYYSGTVFQLTSSGSSWTENVLYSFQGFGGTTGANPVAGVIFDPSGNLYGATVYDGKYDDGTVFELTPSNGMSPWTFTLLYTFSGPDGAAPSNSLVMDVAGNLYGTATNGGAYGGGSIFKLTPGGGGWTFSSLHDFIGGSDGANPTSNLIFDANGNLYGTASAGGAYGWGTVWEITP